MIVIKLDQPVPRVFGISFAHPWLAVKKKAPERKTTCTIFESFVDETSEIPTSNWNELGSAETACSQQDNFNKAVGRKKALERLLCQHDFGLIRTGLKSSPVIETIKKCRKCGSPRRSTVVLAQPIRQAIWETYFKSLENTGAKNN